MNDECKFSFQKDFFGEIQKWVTEELGMKSFKIVNYKLIKPIREYYDEVPIMGEFEENQVYSEFLNCIYIF